MLMVLTLTVKQLCDVGVSFYHVCGNKLFIHHTEVQATLE